LIDGKKILMTGCSGSIGFALAEDLARHNEVWGIARFGDPAERRRVEDASVITRAIDLTSGDFGDLPTNFDYVLHLAAFIFGDDYDEAVRVNGEGTALLMAHCRDAKAMLVMSTTGVYRPNDDPWHAYAETDPLGDAHIPGMPFYSLSKIVQEGVVRACARQIGVPVIICRMNAHYGRADKGLLTHHFNAIRNGEQIVLRWDPNPYSPIHDRDIYDHLEALLDAASPLCPIVNWGGDKAVAAQEWCAFFGELLGVKPNVIVREFPGSQRGVVVDVRKRASITGPCSLTWQEGLRQFVQLRLAAA
jgi:nucleoside-diphosphate-sugar epimerase